MLWACALSVWIHRILAAGVPAYCAVAGAEGSASARICKVHTLSSAACVPTLEQDCGRYSVLSHLDRCYLVVLYSVYVLVFSVSYPVRVRACVCVRCFTCLGRWLSRSSLLTVCVRVCHSQVLLTLVTVLAITIATVVFCRVYLGPVLQW